MSQDELECVCQSIRRELKRVRVLLVEGRMHSELAWLSQRLYSLDVSDTAIRSVRIYAPSRALEDRLGHLACAPDQRMVIKRVKAAICDLPKDMEQRRLRKRLARYIFCIDCYGLAPMQVLNVLANARDGAQVVFLGDPHGIGRDDSPFPFLEIPRLAPEPSVTAPEPKFVVGERIRNFVQTHLLVCTDARTIQTVNVATARWLRSRLDFDARKAVVPEPGDPVWLPYSSGKEGFRMGDRGKYLGHGYSLGYKKTREGDLRYGRKEDGSIHRVELPTGVNIKSERVEFGWCMPLWVVRHLHLGDQPVMFLLPRGRMLRPREIYELGKASSDVTVLANSAQDVEKWPNFEAKNSVSTVSAAA